MHGKSSASSAFCGIADSQPDETLERLARRLLPFLLPFLRKEFAARRCAESPPPLDEAAGTRYSPNKLVVLKFLDLVLPPDGKGGSYAMNDKDILGRVYDLLPPGCQEMFKGDIQGDKKKCCKSLRESLRNYRRTHKT